MERIRIKLMPFSPAYFEPKINLTELDYGSPGRGGGVRLRGMDIEIPGDHRLFGSLIDMEKKEKNPKGAFSSRNGSIFF